MRRPALLAPPGTPAGRLTGVVPAFVAPALLALAACGAGGPPGGAGAGGTSGASAAGAASASACGPVRAGATLPTGWPSLPLLPDDAVLTSVQVRSGARTVVEGVVPRPFQQVLATQRAAYERSGLVLDHGEVEPRDAESDFHGKGVVGRWALREVPGCAGHTSVSVVVKPVS